MQRAMQLEEIQQNWMLDALQSRLNDLKISIGGMLHQIETEFETINWPTFLDNFAIISSHLTGLTKILSRAMGSPLRNLTVLPLLLSPNPDDNLLQLTEGRISVFSHDMVPDYLRTKLEPTAEQRMMEHEEMANSLNAEMVIIQVAQYTKMVSHVFALVRNVREEWELQTSSRSAVQQTSNINDTHTLVSAIGMGKGLKGAISYVGGPSSRPLSSKSVVSPSDANQIEKAPSSIKTNIKSANKIHPYKR